MAEALEEKASFELIKKDEAIEALRVELEKVETEKEQLAGEAAEVPELRKAIEGFMAEVKSLRGKLEASMAAHEAAVKEAETAKGEAKDLGERLESEENNNQALSAEVKALHVMLDEAASLGLASAESYRSALAEYGGVTTPIPEDLSASALFCWFKENVSKLSAFVGGAVDYGAMACGNNLYKMLEKTGCQHVSGVLEGKKFDTPEELGSPAETPKGVKNFMKHFWQRFGRANARLLAETRLAAVSLSFFFLRYLFSFLSCFDVFLFLFSGLAVIAPSRPRRSLLLLGRLR
jgi:hypothetical protein